jgi:hypothetical protein
MRKILIVVAGLASLWTISASAQAVRPQWNYQGSAVCPMAMTILAGYAGLGVVMAGEQNIEAGAMAVA